MEIGAAKPSGAFGIGLRLQFVSMDAAWLPALLRRPVALGRHGVSLIEGCEINIMRVKLGVVMDPIESIQVKKDTTLAMLLAAQARGWSIHYMRQPDLHLGAGGVRAKSAPLVVRDDPADWFSLGEERELALGELDVILMRKDPPFDMDYIYTTYLLEHAQSAGALVVNEARSLRDYNEKLAATLFPECCAPFLVAAEPERLREFHREHRDVVYKPLDGMGGANIFRAREDDPNVAVIIESLTGHGRHQIMAQRFIPEVAAGDRRILLFDGEPVPFALARIPAAGETRGNLAAGGIGRCLELSPRDRWICERIGPRLAAQGLLFVGIDVIGDYLTEINVTSPTCMREIERDTGLDIAGDLMDRIFGKLKSG